MGWGGDGMRRIKDWPAEERPREKLLQRGAEALTDAELLALVLRTGEATAQLSNDPGGGSCIATFDMARGLQLRPLFPRPGGGRSLQSWHGAVKFGLVAPKS